MSNALYDKNLKCPICDNEFTTKRVRLSACLVDKRDADFCTYYKNDNPMYYEVFVCPHCGYAATENSFDNLAFKEIEQLKKLLTGKIINRSFCDERGITDAVDSFKIALFIANSRDAKKSIVAGLCLRLAWLYRELEDEKEDIFLNHSLENYRIAYDNENLPIGNLDEISIQYLIGELSRRLNKLNDAIFWFNKAVTNPERLKNPRIEKLAREQWALVKEQNKKVQ